LKQQRNQNKAAKKRNSNAKKAAQATLKQQRNQERLVKKQQSNAAKAARATQKQQRNQNRAEKKRQANAKKAVKAKLNNNIKYKKNLTKFNKLMKNRRATNIKSFTRRYNQPVQHSASF
jgi:hypothetical protein